MGNYMRSESKDGTQNPNTISWFSFSFSDSQFELLSILAIMMGFGRAPIRNMTHTAIGLQPAKRLSGKSGAMLHVPQLWDTYDLCI